MARPVVIDQDGARGTLVEATSASGAALVRFDSSDYYVATDLLQRQGDDYMLALRLRDLEPAREVVPLVKEELDIGKLTQERVVRIHKTVTERAEQVSVPLESTEVEVQRVDINRPVDGPVDIRTEGDTTIIPVLTEKVVVTKQLILEAEIHITKKRVTDTYENTVTLKEENVEVERAEFSAIAKGEATM